MATLIGITGWQAGALGGLRQVSPLLLTAGAIGACLVFGSPGSSRESAPVP